MSIVLTDSRWCYARPRARARALARGFCLRELQTYQRPRSLARRPSISREGYFRAGAEEERGIRGMDARAKYPTEQPQHYMAAAAAAAATAAGVESISILNGLRF